jgi:DnaJ homolog subfamily C member 28
MKKKKHSFAQKGMLMEFIDWRRSPEKIKITSEEEKAKENKYYGRAFRTYVDERIREAEARGDFENLAGAGKPLSLEDDHEAGEKALGYHLLKSNGYIPFEIELLKEVRVERARVDAKLKQVLHQRKALLNRRVPPFASEKRAFNASVKKAAQEYEKALRDLNRKILTVNLSTPLTMHQPLLQVEKLLQEFQEACPPFPL